MKFLDSPTYPLAPPGTVIYAVGDIHGRLDLLRPLTEHIRTEAREAARQAKRLLAVFLGDFIDRGPESSGVIEHLMDFEASGECDTCFLRGNHEQVLLDLLKGADRADRWLEFGGLQTLTSYGLDPDGDPPAKDEVVETALALIPPAHLDFLGRTKLHACEGDYLFVHAGLRPDRLLVEQSEADLLWFRYFDDAQPVHAHYVVHGHSVANRPVVGRWRAGLDTGAYRSGQLTALRLEGEDRRLLKISDTDWTVREWDRVYAAYSRGGAAKAGGRRPKSKSPGRPRRLRAPLDMLATIGFGLTVFGAAALYFRGEAADPPTATFAAALPAEATVSAAVLPKAVPAPLPPKATIPVAVASQATVQAAPPAAAPAQTAALAPAPRNTQESPVYAVQVAALPTLEAARSMARTRSWPRARAFPDASASVLPARVGGREVFRVVISDSWTRPEAARVCAAMQLAGQDCLVRELETPAPTVAPDS